MALGNMLNFTDKKKCEFLKNSSHKIKKKSYFPINNENPTGTHMPPKKKNKNLYSYQ